MQCRWPLALLGLAVIVALVGLIIWNQSRSEMRDAVGQAAQAVNAVSDSAVIIAEKFRSGAITKTFVASLPKIENSGSGSLELAVLQSTETFRSEDSLRIGWDYVSLGTTVAEISVPVIYRYHLRLEESWRLEVSNQTCLVTAPPIRPTLPPSIDTGQMVKSSRNGWARFNAGEQLKAMEKSLTAKLSQYAGAEDRIALVREPARKTVAAFVRDWLLREDQWAGKSRHAARKFMEAAAGWVADTAEWGDGCRMDGSVRDEWAASKDAMREAADKERAMAEEMERQTAGAARAAAGELARVAADSDRRAAAARGELEEAEPHAREAAAAWREGMEAAERAAGGR